MVIVCDRQLVHSIAVHLLESGPQLRVRVGAFQLFQGEHGLRRSCYRPVMPRYLLDSVQSDHANGIRFASDQEAALVAAEDVFVHQLFNGQAGGDGHAAAAHSLRNRVAGQQALEHHLMHPL